MLFACRVTTGQERVVAKILERKAKKEDLAIYSIAVFEDVRGYIIIEAEDETAARKVGFGMPHVRGILPTQIEMSEINSMIESAKAPVMSIDKGDIVEVTSGAFKGDQAKVLRINTTKEELTVEFVEAAVPIPVTIKANSVKVIKKVKDVESKSK